MNLKEFFSQLYQIFRARPSLLMMGLLMLILGGEGTLDLLGHYLLASLPLDTDYITASLPRLTPLLARIPEGDPAIYYLLVERLGVRGTVILIPGGGLMLIILLEVIVISLRGALIMGAAAEDPINLWRAWGAGWRRIWAMIITASIPPIPITLAAVLIALAILILSLLPGNLLTSPPVISLLTIFSLVVTLPLVLITIGLRMLWPLAERACMLEKLSAVASFRRGWQMVLFDLTPFLIVFLIQWALQTIVFWMLFVPRLLMVEYMILIPVIWLLAGFTNSLISVMWTLVSLPVLDRAEIDH